MCPQVDPFAISRCGDKIVGMTRQPPTHSKTVLAYILGASIRDAGGLSTMIIEDRAVQARCLHASALVPAVSRCASCLCCRHRLEAQSNQHALRLRPGHRPAYYRAHRQVSTGETIFPTSTSSQSKGACCRSPICSSTSCDARGRDVVSDQDGYGSHSGSQSNDGGGSQTDGHNLWETKTLRRQGRMDDSNKRRTMPSSFMWLTQHAMQIEYPVPGVQR